MAGTFALDLSRLCKKTNVDVETAVRKVAFEAFRRVVMKTPVDTGRARANWSVAAGHPNTSVSATATDKSGGATLQQALQGVTAWNCNGTIFMCNNLVYIGALEYGHSSQAPNGMVRVTVEEMQSWVKGLRAK